MSNSEQIHERSVLRITRVMGSIFALADVLLLGGLGIGYILPRLLVFPDLSLVEAVSAVSLLLLLGLVQVLLLPIIATLFGFTSWLEDSRNDDVQNNDDRIRRNTLDSRK